MRGVVPDQLDEDVARRVGAAFVRFADAPEIVVGHDMRPSSAALGGVRRRARPAGRRRHPDRPGLDRPPLLRQRPARTGPARCSPPATTRPVQRDQDVPRGRRAGRPGHRPARDPRGWPRRASRPSPDRPGHITRARRARRVRRSTCASWSTSPAFARSRSSSTRATAWPGTPCRRCSTGCPSTSTADVLRARRHLPQPRGQPDRAGEPARPAGQVGEDGADIGLAFDGDADRCFVVDERGEIVSPSALTALIAVRELAQGGPGHA